MYFVDNAVALSGVIKPSKLSLSGQRKLQSSSAAAAADSVATPSAMVVDTSEPLAGGAGTDDGDDDQSAAASVYCLCRGPDDGSPMVACDSVGGCSLRCALFV